MYTVELKPKACKFIKAQDAQIKRQIMERIKSLANNPRPQNCRLLHSDEKLYRIRSGDYRIIYQISDSQKRVIIAWVDNRKDVYKGL